MGTWGRAPGDSTRCEGCSAPIARDEPVYLATTLKLVRCQMCAATHFGVYVPDADAPDALPAAGERPRPPAIAVPNGRGQWTLLREVRATPLFDATDAARGGLTRKD